MNEQEAKRLCALRELVRETFAQTLMIRTDTISDTADFFDELGGDSLDSLDVAVHLEEICGQRVPEEEYALCRCVEDAALPAAPSRAGQRAGSRAGGEKDRNADHAL